MGTVSVFVDKAFKSGVLNGEQPGAVLPPDKLWESKKNGLVIIECPQRIPCNPCNTSCPAGAVKPFEDINDLPSVDYAKCTGCALCVATCPGLACFVVDLSFSNERALIKLPYEMLPLPDPGDEVECLDRVGEAVGPGRVEAVLEPLKDSTKVLVVSVKKNLILDVRAVRAVN
ncbi:MAG: 4Fe-4S dicluster domain-containing protein [Synergistaceae bacterium]|jgi:Fe-S-cluster-containing hydrogenase component 2|nr:4Fe-4S dicluster domain-containing protein [Synergistaceae bacterium]